MVPALNPLKTMGNHAMGVSVLLPAGADNGHA